MFVNHNYSSGYTCGTVGRFYLSYFFQLLLLHKLCKSAGYMKVWLIHVGLDKELICISPEADPGGGVWGSGPLP